MDSLCVECSIYSRNTLVKRHAFCYSCTRSTGARTDGTSTWARKWCAAHPSLPHQVGSASELFILKHLLNSVLNILFHARMGRFQLVSKFKIPLYSGLLSLHSISWVRSCRSLVFFKTSLTGFVGC